jgi:hypothetical protein
VSSDEEADNDDDADDDDDDDDDSTAELTSLSDFRFFLLPLTVLFGFTCLTCLVLMSVGLVRELLIMAYFVINWFSLAPLLLSITTGKREFDIYGSDIQL